MRAIDLKGVFVPVVTPFLLQPVRLSAFNGYNLHRVNLAGFERNARAHLANRSVSGLVVFGSTGEFCALERQERRQLLQKLSEARAAVDNKKPIVVGVGTEGGEIEALRHAQDARDAGAHAVLLLPPHYYPQHGRPDVVRSFFLRMADASPLPVVVYSIPKCVGFEVTDDVMADVAKHARVIGVKDSSGDDDGMRRLLRLQSDSFSVVTGSAPRLAAHAALGAGGAVLAVANVAAEACAKALRGQAEAQADVTAVHVAAQDEAGGQIALLKAGLDALGLAGGVCRPPLPLRATSVEVERMRLTLAKLSGKA